MLQGYNEAVIRKFIASTCITLEMSHKADSKEAECTSVEGVSRKMVNFAAIEVPTNNITRMATVTITSALFTDHLHHSHVRCSNSCLCHPATSLLLAKNKVEESQSCRSIWCPVRAC